MIGMLAEGAQASILVHSGRMFDLLDPKPEDVDINDIAWALSHIARFTGHTTEFYSVAEHSVIVAADVRHRLLYTQGVSPQERYHDSLWALLHDAPEAYIGDISRPLKLALGQPIREIEQRIMAAIAEAFDLEPAPYYPDVLRNADNVLLATERRDVTSWDGHTEWAGLPDPLGEMPIRCLEPHRARAQFLQVYRRSQELWIHNK